MVAHIFAFIGYIVGVDAKKDCVFSPRGIDVQGPSSGRSIADPDIKEQHLAANIQVPTHKGALWGFPWQFCVRLLNKDVFHLVGQQA